MKSYLAILRNILLICFLFGFVNAENSSIENSSTESSSVEVDAIESCPVENCFIQTASLVQDDNFDEPYDNDETYDNFDVVEAALLNDISKDASLQVESLSDISLEALNAIEQAGPKDIPLSDKIAIGFSVCKDIVKQHVSKNKNRYICGAATATIILSIITAYYLLNKNN
jgi:hypothetical protein